MRTARNISITDFDEQLQIVVKEMCRRVGANPEELDFGRKEDPKDEWYHKFTWTPQEQEEFIEWVLDYLYHNYKARKAFGVIGKSKRACKRSIQLLPLSCWDYTKP